MIFIVKFIIFLLACVPSVVKAAPSLTPWFEVVRPLEIVRLQDGQIGISFLKPCGADYIGVALRQVADAPMSVGILLQRQPTMCVSMPQVETVSVSNLNADQWQPMPGYRTNRSSGARLRFAEMISLSRVEEGGRGVIQAVFEQRCGQVLASVVNNEAAGVLKLGILEETRPGTPCMPEQLARAIRFISVPQTQELAPIERQQRDLERDYDLRLVEVSISGVERQGHVLRIPYVRRCNEVALGAVLRTQNRRQGQQVVPVVSLGILVANFYNRNCEPTVRGDVADVWVQQGVQLPQHAVMQALPGTHRIGALTLRPPVALEPESHRQQLRIAYMRGCEARLGAVYGRDAEGRPTVAILMKRPQVSCTVPARRMEVLQPLSFAALSQQGKIYPMRLEGFRYFM